MSNIELIEGNRPRYKYRVTFSKLGPSRFVGHLDLQTLFQRAVKRAKLPVAYSKGFNPHQLISFGQPLPLGMPSKCELVEIEMEQVVDPKIVIESLNAVLPEGLSATAAELLPPLSKTAAALVYAAVYAIQFPYSEGLSEKIGSIIDGIMKAKEIKILKKTKKGISEADIRPDVYSIRDISAQGQIVLEACLASGSTRNLKPDLIAKYISETYDGNFNPFLMGYERKAFCLGKTVGEPHE